MTRLPARDPAPWPPPTEGGIGQPWRNEQAGLTEGIMAIGTTVTAHGHRAADPAQRLMKAEHLVIAGRDYNLYPDRAS